MNDTNGKEILLQYVTVKVPGKTPKGSKATNAQGASTIPIIIFPQFIQPLAIKSQIYFKLQKIALNFLSSR